MLSSCKSGSMTALRLWAGPEQRSAPLGLSLRPERMMIRARIARDAVALCVARPRRSELLDALEAAKVCQLAAEL